MKTDALALVWIISGTLAALLTVPGTIELILLTVGAVLPSRRPGTKKGRISRIGVVVPAHNEEINIERCVQSLNRCDRSVSGFQVAVVADNCTDATAAIAKGAGARVLVRNDPEHRGKGYALDFAFKTLLEEEFDAFIVVDADTVVESNLVSEFSRLFASGADGVQCRYTVNNSRDSVRTRLMNLALLAFNVLRPRGRDRWGLSVGLLGNGFGLTRETLEAVPYDAVSVVEDLEYHIRLVRAGRRVRFGGSVTVRADMPAAGREWRRSALAGKEAGSE